MNTELDRSLFTEDVVQELLAQGLSKAEIGRLFGVSRQAVLQKAPREFIGPARIVEDSYPWTVDRELTRAVPYTRSREHAKYMALGREALSDDQAKRLRSWYRLLRNMNVVVEYDPEIPALEGISTNGGWRYVARTPEDGELIVRVNEYTRMTVEGRSIWVFPPEDP